MDPITKYLLNEGYLLSDKTISVNLSEFQSGQKKKLLIVGVMGSGKTTIGEKLSKQLKVKWYSLDSFWWRIKEEHFKGRSYEDLTEKEIDKLFEFFRQNIIDILKRNERAIVEGINLASPNFRSLILKQAMIILGLSSLKAGIRAAKRNRKKEDEGRMLYYWLVKKNMLQVEPLIKKLRKDVMDIPGVEIKEYKI